MLAGESGDSKTKLSDRWVQSHLVLRFTLTPKSRVKLSPKPFSIAQKAIILHAVGVEEVED